MTHNDDSMLEPNVLHLRRDPSEGCDLCDGHDDVRVIDNAGGLLCSHCRAEIEKSLCEGM